MQGENDWLKDGYYAGGYDGEALLFQDVMRSAPMDPASTVPDAPGGMPFDVAARKPIDPEFPDVAAPHVEDDSDIENQMPAQANPVIHHC